MAGFSCTLALGGADKLAVVARLLAPAVLLLPAPPTLLARLASVVERVRLAAVAAAAALLVLLELPPLRRSPGMPGRGSLGTGMPGKGSRGRSLRGPQPPRLLLPLLPGLGALVVSLLVVLSMLSTAAIQQLLAFFLLVLI